MVKHVFQFLVLLAVGFGLTGCIHSDSSWQNGDGTVSYPLDTKERLTFWCPLNRAYPEYDNLGQTPFAKELEACTGIAITYMHPRTPDSTEQFDIMLASSNLPDIIMHDWRNVVGGPDYAIQNGYILELNNLIERCAPNLRAVLDANPQMDKLVQTDKGKYYVFPFLILNEELLTHTGPMVRDDWLSDLGETIPVTIEDWHRILTRFKQEKGAAAPLSLYGSTPIYSAFIGAYGIIMDFYQEDGIVKYGPYQPEYLDFLRTFRQWYQEGLIDRNLGSIDERLLETQMLSNNTGATVGHAAQDMGQWIGRHTDTRFSLAAAPYPVLETGTTPKFGQRDAAYASNWSIAISSQCKNADLAARWLDYAYSERGHMLYNFGKEEESYTIENGNPHYTELITANPNGLTMPKALLAYTGFSHAGAYVLDERASEQHYPLAAQQNALTVWGATTHQQHVLPQLRYNAAESECIAQYQSELTAYVSDNFFRFVMGARPLDEFEAYRQTLHELGLEEVTAAIQQALNRYHTHP